MGTRDAGDLPARLEQTRRRFDRWRRTRQGRSRIPEALWAAAVKAAEAYGLARASRVLGLDYYTLKKHVEASSTHGAPEQEASATFVELASPVSAGTRECLLELEDPGGAKMRVHLKGLEAPDLAALSRSFWSAEG